jgi:hypothetical protein
MPAEMTVSTLLPAIAEFERQAQRVECHARYVRPRASAHDIFMGTAWPASLGMWSAAPMQGSNARRSPPRIEWCRTSIVAAMYEKNN